MPIALLQSQTARLRRRVVASVPSPRHLLQAWQGPPMAARAPTLPLQVLQLRGSQRAMGEQHGELARASGGWEDTVAWYPGMAARIVSGKRSHPLHVAMPLVVAGLGDGLLQRLHARRPAALRERSAGFYEALGRHGSEARFLGVMDLLQNLIGLAGRAPGSGVGQRWSQLVPGACSTLAVWGGASAGGGMLLGRNFDFPGSGCWEQGPTVVFCTPDQGLRYGFVSTRGADVPAVSVWNEAGLVATIHTRFHRAVRFDARLAIDFMHELIRRAATIDEAIAVLREAPVASTWGVVLASAGEQRAVLVELHGDDVVVIPPRPDEEFLACTNRYQAPAMMVGELEPTPGWLMHSDGRHLALRRGAGRGVAAGGLDAAGLAALLGSHEDPEIDGLQRAAGGVLAQSNGVQSVVIDPVGQRTWVAVGDVPVSRGPWIEVPWRWDDSPGTREHDLAALRDNHRRSVEESAAPFQAGAQGHAYQHFLEAARLETAAAPLDVVAAELELAARLDPSEPTWRLLAGGFALGRGDLAAARDDFEAGLESERSPFYRARLLLWSARAAEAAGAAGHAATLRRELRALEHPRAQAFVRLGAGDGAGFTPAQARRCKVAVQLCDLG